MDEKKSRILDLFSGSAPLVSIIVFLLATALALAAAWESQFNMSTRIWLAVGWLLASSLVATAAFNAQRELERADRRRDNLRAQGLQVSGNTIADAAVPAVLISNVILFLVSGLTVVSFCTAGDRCGWAAAMIWSMATLLIGGLVGFLFGMPRSAESTAEVAAAAAASAAAKAVTETARRQGLVGAAEQEQKVETPPTRAERPIEEIADWLTKTIVGIGLVNLKDMPGELRRWAEYVARGVAIGHGGKFAIAGWSGDPASFVLGFLLYFACFGFLAGYLLTQLFLRPYVNQ